MFYAYKAPMVTQSHTQLKEDEITEDLLQCDNIVPNLKNFLCLKKMCIKCMEDASHEKLYGDLQRISMLRKKLKSNLKISPTTIITTIEKRKVFLSIIGTF